MGDKTDIRLVDPHAESDGRDNDHAFLPQETLLVALACRRVEPGMVRDGLAAARRKPGSGLLDRSAGKAVDDPGVAGVLFGEKPPKLLERSALRNDAVEQIGPIVAGGEDPRLGEPELRDNVSPRRLVCGGGQRHERDLRKALLQNRQLLIFRPEIMAPLRDAVRLVDGKESKAAMRKKLDASWRDQPLGRHVEEVERATANFAFDLGRIGGRQA